LKIIIYCFIEIAIVSYEPDDAVKEKKMITLTQEVIPFYLTKMNVVAKENDGHLVLNRVKKILCTHKNFKILKKMFFHRQPGLISILQASSTT
jgi:hypothetical protein